MLNMALQGGLTYQNPAALGEQWWRFELRPTATAQRAWVCLLRNSALTREFPSLRCACSGVGGQNARAQQQQQAGGRGLAALSALTSTGRMLSGGLSREQAAP